jgi:hypothetical protein
MARFSAAFPTLQLCLYAKAARQATLKHARRGGNWNNNGNTGRSANRNNNPDNWNNNSGCCL